MSYVHDLAYRIDARLPQTQCTKCGFDGCRPYAEAIAANEADIDRCPPGGEAGIRSLAQLLGRPVIPLDMSRGMPGPLRVARIDERHCIGCTLCIQACPVDAIVGANKFMHTILQAACTGCDLCVAPCPVDCIHMEPVAPAREWTTADAAAARTRFLRREHRLRLADTADNGAVVADALPLPDDSSERKKAILAQALARARARRAS